jgi:4-hydroxy-3-polyprenylbenzoate decarboxylase
LRQGHQNRLVIAVTGASGSLYAEALTLRSLQAGIPTYLVFSPTAEKVIRTEIPRSLLAAIASSKRRAGFESDPELSEVVSKLELKPEQLTNLKTFAHDDLYSPIASGSLGATHMVVVPASMGSLARIATGMSGNLIERCADVMLKERRPLVIVPRETPLNLIHLQNMTSLLQAGARIVPAMPAFYYQPKSIADIANFMTERICEQIGIEALSAANQLHWNAARL